MNSKPDVLMIGPLLPHTMAQLEARFTLHRYDLAPDRDALIDALAPHLRAVATRGDYPLPGSLMRRLPNVKLIASSGAGYDAIEIEAARGLGIAVTHTPGAGAECVADTAWALILATVRRTVFHDRYVRSGGWLKAPVPLTGKVWGERLGIIGLGRIGKAIARRGEAFRMEIAYHGRRRQDVAYRFYASPVELARNVDILVIAIPGRDETRGYVGRAVIDALGPKGYLINVSRGSTVDESCLVEALVGQRLAGAGLDVFADEPRVPEALFALDQVVLQPHTGSGTYATRHAMGQMVVDNLVAFFAGEPLISPVG